MPFGTARYAAVGQTARHRGAVPDVLLSTGSRDVVLARETADRVGLGPDSHGVPATVTLFHSDVVALTGAGGATAAIGSAAAEALLMLPAVGAVAGGGHLWRRSGAARPGGPAGQP